MPLSRRSMLSSALSCLTIGCGTNSLRTGRNGRVIVQSRPPEVSPDATTLRKVLVLKQNSITDFGRDVSVLVGRALYPLVGYTHETSYLEEEIKEIIRLQYDIAAQIVSGSFDDLSVQTVAKTNTELKVQHRASTDRVDAKDLPRDGRFLMDKLSLAGDGYGWQTNSSGTMTYTSMNPSRYVSTLNVEVNLFKVVEVGGIGAIDLTQSTVNGAALEISRLMASRTSRILERRYGLNEGTIQVEFTETALLA